MPAENPNRRPAPAASGPTPTADEQIDRWIVEQFLLSLDAAPSADPGKLGALNRTLREARADLAEARTQAVVALDRLKAACEVLHRTTARRPH